MGREVIWTPQPKQRRALRCPAFELFFGGAAGGGKSDFLLNDFLEGARKYGRLWYGILFRQTTSELEQLLNRSHELFEPMGGRFKGSAVGESHNTWHFPKGATLKLRYLESENHVRRYQGHEYTWIGMDELGNYPSPFCWDYMISRARSTHGVPCYIRGTANPGGVGHGWIKQRFMDGHEPNKIFYAESVDFKGKVHRTSRCFIPSTLDDNKYLLETDYEARLMNMPAHLARALRYGDWTVMEGQVFDAFVPAKHVIGPMVLRPGEWYKFAAMDWGFSKPFAIYWFAVNSAGRVVVYREYYGCREGEYNVGLKKGAREVAAESMAMSMAEGVYDMVADPAVWNKDDDRQSIAEEFEKAGWKMHKANNDRMNGLVSVYDYLNITLDTESGKVPLLTIVNSCRNLIRTLPLLTPDKNHPEDVDTKLEDHAYDALRYGLMSDFVHHPVKSLRRQSGSWQREEKAESFDPFNFM